jgi:hypothetical protein
MTPPIPTSNDLVRLTSKKRQTVNLIINAVPLNPVASAVINQASILYPLSQLTVSDTENWSEAVAGRQFSIGTAPGLSDVTWGVLRRDAGVSTLYHDAKYNGDSGSPRSIQQLIEDGYFITIYDARPAWGIQSSIRNGVFYKNWDQRFTASSKDPRPVVRLGSHLRSDADTDTGLARFTIAADIFHFPGRSTFEVEWEADNGTIISEADDELVVDFPPGCHEVRCIVTDTKGKVTTAYRKVFVNGEGYLPFASTAGAFMGRYRCTSADCTQDRTGYTITLTIDGAIEPGDVYPGQMFLLSEVATWADGETLDEPDAVAHTFVGYASEAQTRTARGVRQTTLTIYAPVTLADKVPIAKQTIITKTTPGNWSEVIPALGNPVGYFYYLTALHAPYLIDGHDFDFDPDLRLLKRRGAEFTRGEDLGSALKQLATFLNGMGVIASRTDGTTRMLRHPNYMDNDERNELSTQFTWGAGTIRKELAHQLNWRFNTGQSYAGAFATKGASETLAYKAVAPGFVGSQAPGHGTLDDTTVPFESDSQVRQRVRALAGYHHAATNPGTVPDDTLADRNLDVAQPCDVDRWQVFNVASSYDPLGEGWVSQRRLCTQVRRRWGRDADGGKTIEHAWEVETFGYPGQLIPLNANGAKIWQARPVPVKVQPYAPLLPDLGLESPIMYVWTDAMRRASTQNFAQPRGVWDFENAATVFVTLDPFSPYFSDPNMPIEFGLLKYNEDTGILSLSGISTLPMEEWIIGPGFYGDAVLLMDSETEGYWAVLWRERDGTHVYRSEDSGATWDAGEVFGHADPQVGETIPVQMGAALFDERLVFTAHLGETNDDGDFIYYVFTADSPTDLIIKIDNPTTYQVNPASIVLTSATNAVVGMYRPQAPEPDEVLTVVTFEEGDDPPEEGYSQYTISGSHGGPIGDSGINDFAGERQAFADFDSDLGGNGANSVAVTVTVDLTAFYTFDSVIFDTRAVNTPATGKRTLITVTAQDAEGLEIGHAHEIELGDAWPDTSGDEHTVSAENLGITTEWVWYIRISVEIIWDTIDTAAIATVFLDNIDIDADLVDFTTDQAVHTLNLSSEVYTKRNSYQLLPFHHFGLSVVPTTAVVFMIGRDEGGNQPYLMRSSNSGQTWSKVRSVPGLVGLKARSVILDDPVIAMILFGYNQLGVSIDGGVTGYNAMGDLAGKLDHVGLIDGIAGVFSGLE